MFDNAGICLPRSLVSGLRQRSIYITLHDSHLHSAEDGLKLLVGVGWLLQDWMADRSVVIQDGFLKSRCPSHLPDSCSITYIATGQGHSAIPRKPAKRLSKAFPLGIRLGIV